MSLASYSQRGESLDYKNTSEAVIAANTIIPITTRVGVAGDAIAVNEVGSLHVAGVFEMPKNEDDEIAMGAAVFFDGTQITITEGTNTPAGYAAADAAATTTTVLVKLLG